jgi:hypothetical protein
MKRLLFLLLVTIAFDSNSQIVIKLEDISKHVGDSVNVCGKVAGGRYMDQSESKLTLINIGGTFPNQVYSIVISSDLRKQFETAPESLFLDKEVCVTGKVSIYRDRPQIVIYRKDQIQSGKQ